ncbi:stalk domain-containing protein [Paenibacillus sp. YIM B09110]|uniref:stalk domain-containing protein n=1 Tax=Paenibacillus sp. YIM B09110 TaxID=3126102 RepID=UPI00301C9B1B
MIKDNQRPTKPNGQKPIISKAIALSIAISIATAGAGHPAEAAERKPAQIVFVHGEKQVSVNGTVKPTAAPMPVVKGVTMIPIRLIASAIGAKVYNDKSGTHIDTYANKVTLNVNMRGTKRNNSYKLMAAPALSINGTLHVPISAVSLLWTGSYTFDKNKAQLSIVIQPDPNVPPVADFQLPIEVKRGERVLLQDLSYDPDGKLAKVEWIDRKEVYFEAGTYTITQKVYDNDGASSHVTRQLKVTDEVMYTPFEYYMRFGTPGAMFDVDTRLMNTYEEAVVTETRGGRTLYMSNAPERFFDEGLLYEDELDGAGRLFIHHRNGSSERLKLAVVVTNEQSEAVQLTIGNRGLAGPSHNALQFGFAAVKRYLTGAAPRVLTIEPNTSAILLPELDKIALNQNNGISGLIDVDSDGPLTYTTMALKESTDPLDVVHNLPSLEKVGNRGTFANTDLSLVVGEPLGITAKKLRLGHRGTSITGVDALTGQATVDGGEYGAVNTIKLTDVAYGTRILFNPRAGNFLGAIEVNGEVISVPAGGFADPSKGVLLHIQHQPEGDAALLPPPEVTIRFTSPGASSLPVLLVILPGSAFE